jgi:glycosyltransferase involved in cell wall biosynthesis
VRIALLGTRGVPAQYGGFETAVEEIGRRLAARGHSVIVYCRGAAEPRPSEHLGMELVHLPAARRKSLETLTHTALSICHLILFGRKIDAAIVFNAANAPLVPFLRLRTIPTAIHVDGLEWKRAKWRGLGRYYYRVVESLSVRWADALIADAPGISQYYHEQFGAPTELLRYGAPIQEDSERRSIQGLNLRRKGYHLMVARFEPENHVLEIVTGYRSSRARLPLVVVGSAPYSDAYTAQVRRIAGDDCRIQLLGSIWDQNQLDDLYANALTYIHGHSVGGTNPSLLRAMGAGTAVLAFDVNFNREVLANIGGYFHDQADLTPLIENAESQVDQMVRQGCTLRDHARRQYRWEDVAMGYENLLGDLCDGKTNRGVASGRRLRSGR